MQTVHAKFHINDDHLGRIKRGEEGTDGERKDVNT